MIKRGLFKQIVLFYLVFLIGINFSLAYDFSVKLGPVPKDYYEGETVSLEASVTAEVDWWCELNCKWATPDMGEKMICDGCGIPDNTRKDFVYQTISSGNNGIKEFVLTVSCKRDNNAFNCFESDYFSRSYDVTFNYGYNGDGICQNDKGEDCLSSDCVCGSGKDCMADILRKEDNLRCTTFCGNGLIESVYENCTNCPLDVGKCDGTSCIKDEECEGEYCAHEVCSSTPYIKGDGFCDFDKEENCKNSVLDCGCEKNERCSAYGVCEVYCGNGVCEEKERGICKADCEWCGDGNCQKEENCFNCQEDCGFCEIEFKEGDGLCEDILGENCKNSEEDCKCEDYEECDSRGKCSDYCGNGICNSEEVGVCIADCEWCGDKICDSSRGEDCQTCENDCGICESDKKTQKIIEEAQKVVKESLKDVEEKRLKIVYFSLIAIIIVLIIYFGFKLVKSLINKK